MNQYIIGDIHGCLSTLQALLDKINYDPQSDQLYFTGDLVNRGPQSLETLHFIKSLPHAETVLGNHDFHLLALHAQDQAFSKKHNLDQVLNAPECNMLINWLRQRPIALWIQEADILIVHAGIHPDWSTAECLQYSQEVSQYLKRDQWQPLIQHLYGDKPDTWHDDLQNWERLRTITNILTRMRFCTASGQMNFQHTGPIGSQPNTLIPWFDLPHQHKNTTVAFGHWAALEGKIKRPNILALDGGCVWGKHLLAYHINNQVMISQAQLS